MVESGFIPSIDKPAGLSPLVRFRGVLDIFEARDREFTNEDGSVRQSRVIDFKFRELEVLESTEVYAFPIATVSVGYAPPATSGGGSRWEVLAGSIRNKGLALPDLVGKGQEWYYTDAKVRQPVVDPDGNPVMEIRKGRSVQKWADQTAQAWQVVSIDGLSPQEDLTDYIVSVMDGKTESQLNQALMTDSKIIARPDIVTSLTDRKLLDTLLMAGKVSRDSEGVIHRV